MRKPIYDSLIALKDQGRIPYHMPGHMRKGRSAYPGVEACDITEIAGYDDLHCPSGIIRESMDILREIYHTRRSWYLVGGSTLGILIAIYSSCKEGDTILISRNCHKSVYHAIRLLKLRVLYLYPQYDQIIHISMHIDMKDVETKLEENPDIACVVLTSPTYEGVVSDIRSISEIVHEKGIPLIVDEAHGAHMIFHDAFPKSAVECGADLVVQSTHKTLPALTQTALLHLCSDRIDPEAVEEMIDLFETSSPSYLLLSSTEYSVLGMAENVYNVEKYVDNLTFFRNQCDILNKLHIISTKEIDAFDYDVGKLVISLKGCREKGIYLYRRLLDRYGIELEAACRDYCIGMTSVCTDKNDFDRLFQALEEIDKEMVFDPNETAEDYDLYAPAGGQDKCMEIWEAAAGGRWTDLLSAEGKICSGMVSLYPPGIPILVPGERITADMITRIAYFFEKGYNITGMNKGGIRVL